MIFPIPDKRLIASLASILASLTEVSFILIPSSILDFMLSGVVLASTTWAYSGIFLRGISILSCSKVSHITESFDIHCSTTFNFPFSVLTNESIGGYFSNPS